LKLEQAVCRSQTYRKVFRQRGQRVENKLNEDNQATGGSRFAVSRRRRNGFVISRNPV
jgi:hypothetical protein